ncbi:phasin family protein [uncultured Roseovarius sp.]|uniref:phasin family protein n=1 Tax=uncultured Roseovarius sp. TaxID=293344 RepID=UPI0025DC5542|nr:phasin family protein [uncultured Roseovarius sp.]
MAKSKKTYEAATGGLPAMTAAMMVGNPALAKAWTEVMTESARFVSERLQHDFETQKVMMACKTPAEVMQVQSEFFRKAMQDYSEEAQRMYQIMTGSGEDALKQAKSGTKRGYDDVPV